MAIQVKAERAIRVVLTAYLEAPPGSRTEARRPRKAGTAASRAKASR
jgi:hypothetical protein